MADPDPSRNSPAKKQQRVASPQQAHTHTAPPPPPPPPLCGDNTTSVIERANINAMMIDQQLAEIQSILAGKAISPTVAASSTPSPSPSAITSAKPIAVVTPRKTVTKETPKENTNDAWTTVVQSKKNTSVPIAAVAAVTNGPGPKPSTSKKGSTSAAAVAKAAKEEAAAILAGKITKSFLCPASRVRYVIGTKGVILKRLMTQSGATITTITTDVVPPGKDGNDSSEPAQIFTIKGTKEEVEKAEDLIASVSANGAKAIA